MRFDTLLLASLPSALGLQLAYAPPPELMAKANAADNNCVLPASYMVQNFVGTSNDTGNSLGSFDFRFVDSETQITTRCHFNSSSKSTTPGSLTPRYACENGEVKFIWEDEDGDLTMVERVCPGSDEYVLPAAPPLPLPQWSISFSNPRAARPTTRSLAASTSSSFAVWVAAASPTLHPTRCGLRA